MKVIFKKNNKIFICEIAKTFFEKAKGLMFSKKKNILFLFNNERLFPIHSWFVFFPFDAVYLNSKKRVVEIVKQIKPFKILIKNTKPALYLLELAEKNHIKVGDYLNWKEKG